MNLFICFQIVCERCHWITHAGGRARFAWGGRFLVHLEQSTVKHFKRTLLQEKRWRRITTWSVFGLRMYAVVMGIPSRTSPGTRQLGSLRGRASVGIDRHPARSAVDQRVFSGAALTSLTPVGPSVLAVFGHMRSSAHVARVCSNRVVRQAGKGLEALPALSAC
jgi:hypothetical protein